MGKREFGQYFTKSNPFMLPPFQEWFNRIPSKETLKYIEPFAGENNIPLMIDDTVAKDLNWSCFDIEPGSKNNYGKALIEQRDTISDFPSGYDVAITNPPYLANYSAKRRGLDYPCTRYDNIYKQCLDVMLANVDFVAAIVPETYIISGLFTRRLDSAISLTCKMFDDTGCPVCLALFNKDDGDDDFKVYRMSEYIGTYSELNDSMPRPSSDIKWKFNDRNGEIGIVCIDNTKCASIMFIDGKNISSEDIKSSSRLITRVSGLPSGIPLSKFICECNRILAKYREDTKDVLMAAFKGLRMDSLYRRRLDFKTAKMIMNQCIDNIKGDKP